MVWQSLSASTWQPLYEVISVSTPPDKPNFLLQLSAVCFLNQTGVAYTGYVHSTREDRNYCCPTDDKCADQTSMPLSAAYRAANSTLQSALAAARGQERHKCWSPFPSERTSYFVQMCYIKACHQPGFVRYVSRWEFKPVLISLKLYRMVFNFILKLFLFDLLSFEWRCAGTSNGLIRVAAPAFLLYLQTLGDSK